MNLKLLIDRLKENREIAKSRLIANLTTEGSYIINARVGKHKLVFDKPEVLGDTATSPTSAETLLSSVGAFIISNLQMWATILNINLDIKEANIMGTIDH